MLIIDNNLLDQVTSQAQASPRLRMNYNLHDSLDARAQRLLNAMEPGTELPVHRHMATAETYMVLRGRIRVLFYNECHQLEDSQLLDPAAGRHGVQIPAGQWHTIEVLDPGTVIFEVKDGPYTPLTPENTMTL